MERKSGFILLCFFFGLISTSAIAQDGSGQALIKSAELFKFLPESVAGSPVKGQPRHKTAESTRLHMSTVVAEYGTEDAVVAKVDILHMPASNTTWTSIRQGAANNIHMDTERSAMVHPKIEGFTARVIVNKEKREAIVNVALDNGVVVALTLYDCSEVQKAIDICDEAFDLAGINNLR